MKHESRSEPGSAPVFEVPVYSKGLLSEHSTTAIELAIVTQIVYPHFKAATRYLIA
jgi:hypothetical protein